MPVLSMTNATTGRTAQFMSAFHGQAQLVRVSKISVLNRDDLSETAPTAFDLLGMENAKAQDEIKYNPEYNSGKPAGLSESTNVTFF